MANNNLIESPIDGPGGGTPGGVADAALGIPSDRIYDDAAARDAALPTPLQGWTCAIRDGSGGQIWQIYDATLPGWLPTGTGSGVTPDTWRDETGTISNPDFTDVARHDADLIINGISVGLGGGQISNNFRLGNNALGNNISGVNNFAIGLNALANNTIGSENLGSGVNALFANISGIRNVANGSFSLRSNTTGGSNVGNGSRSLLSNVSGSFNVANGRDALENNATGSQNVGEGAFSLRSLTSGTANVGLGFNTGIGISTGNANTILGANVTGLASGLSNTVIVADGQGNFALYRPSTGEVGLAGVTDPTESVDVPGTARLRNTPSNDAGGFSIDRIGLIAPAGEVYSQVNPEGQVKINDGGGIKPNQTGFVANTVYPLAYSGALNYSVSPTTQVPGNLTLTDSNFIDPVNGNILESGILGQATKLRFLVEYANASNQNANFAIYIGIANLDNPGSTFTAFGEIFKPDGVTSSVVADFSSVRPGAANPIRTIQSQIVIEPIADNLSFPTGYAPCVVCTQTDNTLSVTLGSLVLYYPFKVVR